MMLTEFENSPVRKLYKKYIKQGIFYFYAFEAILIIFLLIVNPGNCISIYSNQYSNDIIAMLIITNALILLLYDTLLTKIKLFLKIHLLTTLQFINSISWAVIFYYVIKYHSFSIIGLIPLGLALLNVGAAIIEEGWGEINIENRKKQ